MTATKLDGMPFTPVFDSLVDELGALTALVFGRVWRYCQMERGYCHAEQGRIAEELGISRRTVMRALSVLVRAGYLDDSTPNEAGKTRIYRDTGKLKTGRRVLEEPVTESHTTCDRESQVPVTESHTKRLLKRQTKKLLQEREESTTLLSVTGQKESSSVVSFLDSFLNSASEEQLEAFKLVSKFSSQKKAVEVAGRENPVEAARDYLVWCADRGGRTARKLLAELEEAEGASFVNRYIENAYAPVPSAHVSPPRLLHKMQYEDALRKAGYDVD